jgi:4-amino-4-deoxy-L-arabinose transferase-like glycosyltransferase
MTATLTADVGDPPAPDGDERQVPARHRMRRAVLTAVVVGGLLRLAWVIWATRTPVFASDPSEYIRIALELGKGTSPRFGGVGGPSAHWSPGYPIVLSPFVWFADRTGLLSPAFAASLVNVAAGTLTIWLTALLAERWVGLRSMVTAAWLVALWPSLIYFTSTAHTETAFTPVLLGAYVLAGSRTRDVRDRTWLLVGLLVGLGFLFRAPGIIGLAAPLLALRVRRGSWQACWREGLRATGIVLVGAAILLVPWTIRNGVQVGIWSPGSTSNASALCFGHNDGAEASWETSLNDIELQTECFQGSPYDDARAYVANGQEVPPGVSTEPPDEVAWYQEKVSDAASWAVSHPAQEAQLTVEKVWETWGSEGRVVEAARNYDSTDWAGSWMGPLGTLANLWLWVVGGLAIAGLVMVPAVRKALPVWVPIVLFTLAIVAALAQPHYRFPVLPFVAVLAAGFLHRHRLDGDGSSSTRDRRGTLTTRLDGAPPPSEFTTPIRRDAGAGPPTAGGHGRAMSLLVPMLVAGAVAALLFARGRTEGAALLVVVVVGLTQARALSPVFDRRFLHALEAFGRGVGHVLTWILLGAMFVFVFVPLSLVARIFRRTPLGRPRGYLGASWIPKAVMEPEGAPTRTFGAEPTRAPGAKRSKLVLAFAVVAVLLVADLAVGALFTASGRLLPIDRGDLETQVTESIMVGLQRPPIGDEPWADQHGRDMAAFELQTNDFIPYLMRGHHDYSSETINVTEAERVSYEPDLPAGVEPLRVAFFGGSVMFGVGQRDEHTIPSAFARIAEEQGVPVVVDNYGFPAWVSWQEMQLFERRLAEGGEYDMAIFLDGFNEFHIQASDYNENPTHNSANIVNGLVNDFREDRAHLPGPLDGVGELAESYHRASGAWRIWDAVQGNDSTLPGREGAPTGTPEQQTDNALGIYGRAKTLVEDIGEDSGTPVRFFWQPSKVGWTPEVLERLPEGTVDLSDVFGGATTPYYDEVHTDEVGAEVIAQAMWDQVGPELTALADGGPDLPIALPAPEPTG